MPIEPSPDSPAHAGHLISRRRIIGAGLVPLLPLEAIGGEPAQVVGRHSALALPLQLLYEISVWVAWYWERKEKKKQAAE